MKMNNKASVKGVLITILIIIGLIAFWFLSMALGWIGGAAGVAQKEFSAEAMLKKYEWFKDASHQLDKKSKDVDIYIDRVDELKSLGLTDRFSRQELFQLQSELAGVKGSFNILCEEYNAQSTKFTWDKFKTSELRRTCIVR